MILRKSGMNRPVKKMGISLAKFIYIKEIIDE